MENYKIDINKKCFKREDAMCYDRFTDLLTNIVQKYKSTIENELIDKEFK